MSFLSLQDIDYKSKNDPKIFKIFKIFKKERNQSQQLWHSLRSCRFKSKSKSNNAFALLMLFFKNQEHQYVARRHSLITMFMKQKKQKPVFQGGE